MAEVQKMPQQPSARPQAVQSPTLPEDREDLVWDALPVFGTAGKAWHVMVRHSPFLLKRAIVRAESKEEAQRTFLEETRKRHEDRASKQKMDEWGRLTAERIRAAMTEGLRMNGAGELAWSITVAEDEANRRRQIREKIGQRWDEPRLAMAQR